MPSLLSIISEELFANGRAAEGIPKVAREIAEDAGTTLEREGLTLVTRQMAREYSALTRDLYEATGNATAGGTLDQVANGFLHGRFVKVPVDGWSVANDNGLRSKLVDTALEGMKDKQPVPQITESMQQVHAETISMPAPQVAPVKTQPVPTSHRMTTTQAAPPQSPIGSFGTIAFQVSRENTITPEKFNVSRPARFAEHAILHAAPKGQHLGIGLRAISITIKLMHPFCKRPAARIADLEAIQESEQAYPLVLGGRNYGNYALLNLDVTVNKFGHGGAIQSAEVQLKLKEYF